MVIGSRPRTPLTEARLWQVIHQRQLSREATRLNFLERWRSKRAMLLADLVLPILTMLLFHPTETRVFRFMTLPWEVAIQVSSLKLKPKALPLARVFNPSLLTWLI